MIRSRMYSSSLDAPLATASKVVDVAEPVDPGPGGPDPVRERAAAQAIEAVNGGLTRKATTALSAGAPGIKP